MYKRQENRLMQPSIEETWRPAENYLNNIIIYNLYHTSSLWYRGLTSTVCGNLEHFLFRSF